MAFKDDYMLHIMIYNREENEFPVKTSHKVKKYSILSINNSFDFFDYRLWYAIIFIKVGGAKAPTRLVPQPHAPAVVSVVGLLIGSSAPGVPC